MNILFFTAHPAQVHNLRAIKDELEKNGHQVFWMATEKDISKYLLNHYKIDVTFIEKPQKGFFSKAKTLIINTIKCVKFIRENNINILVSRISPYISLSGFLLSKPHIALADTESSGIYNKIFAWFTSANLTPKSFKRELNKNQIRFDGNIELFYLHPNRFTPMPREQVSDLLGIETNTPYVIMRFVSWDAYHDKGLSGFTDKNKLKAVDAFSNYARVFISSEKPLPAELEKYKIKFPPEKMHDVLAHAILFFGESATMASESVVLGTPAIFLNENWFGNTEEEKKFGLLFSFKQNHFEQERSIQKGIEILAIPQIKTEMIRNRDAFLKNKIDVTEFMVWFIENYPSSFKIMKENPDYQYRFK